MGGGGTGWPCKNPLPDWRSYVVDDRVPELKKCQDALAAKGLKDPWIR